MRKLLFICGWLIGLSAGTLLLGGCNKFGNDLADLRLKQRNDAADAKAVLEFERAAALKAKQMLEWKEFKSVAEEKNNGAFHNNYRVQTKRKRKTSFFRLSSSAKA
ncbi:MAG: hypothetical protein IPP46_18445 [Bacteroidetes bacterium]|nr:hypothetical protein [Bacteroidota bacterium]